MPGTSAIVSLISQDLTQRLVSATGGLLLQPTIANITNASPPVVTMSGPHQLLTSAGAVPRVSHVVINGVAGLGGLNGGVFLATPITATTFSLSVQGPDGTVSPAPVTGSYTGGGTVSLGLVDGRILFGRQHIAENSYAPRVVFVPKAERFGARDTYNRSPSVGEPTAEVLQQTIQRSIASDTADFEVHVWGQAATPDPDGGDIDTARLIYQTLMLSAWLLMPGSVSFGTGMWASQVPKAPLLAKAGEEFVFTMSIATPVLDVALQLGPGTKSAAAVYYQPPDLTILPEIAASGL